MLSLQRFRDLLEKTGERLSDDDLTNARDQMYALAHALINRHCTETNDAPEKKEAEQAIRDRGRSHLLQGLDSRAGEEYEP